MKKKDGIHKNDNIRSHIYDECKAMAEYALRKGKSVPTSTIETIELFEKKEETIPKKEIPSKKKSDDSGDNDGEEAENNVGKDLKIDKLVNAHENLSEIVKPATPQAILLLHTERKKTGRLRILGPIPIIRHMILVAIFSLVSFIGLLAFSNAINKEEKDAKIEMTDIDKKQKDKNIDTTDTGKENKVAKNGLTDTDKKQSDTNNKMSGISVFICGGKYSIFDLLFLLSASGLGASFAALYKANNYITTLTFNQDYQSTYWIQFLLGLISGLILAVVISEKTIEGIEFLTKDIVRPLLAILGGFSADLVYTFLNRMVETLKSLFEGSPKEIVKAKLQKNQIKSAASIAEIQQEIGPNTKPEEIKAKLKKLFKDLMPGENI